MWNLLPITVYFANLFGTTIGGFPFPRREFSCGVPDGEWSSVYSVRGISIWYDSLLHSLKALNTVSAIHLTQDG